MEEISTQDLYQKLQKEKLILVDVREAEEFAAGHIKGARHFPLSRLEKDYSQLDRQQPLYIICRSGGRSARACAFLQKQGYQVTNVQGGVEAWSGEFTS